MRCIDRSYSFFIAAILLPFCMVSCSKVYEPGDVAVTFIQETLQSEYESAYKYLSAGDKGKMSPSELKASVPVMFDEMRLKNPLDIFIKENIKGHVLKTEISNVRATITVEFTIPDVAEITKKGNTTLEKAAKAPRSEYEKLLKDVIKNIKKSGTPIYKKKKMIKMVKEDGFWKVEFNKDYFRF